MAGATPLLCMIWPDADVHATLIIELVCVRSHIKNCPFSGAQNSHFMTATPIFADATSMFRERVVWGRPSISHRIPGIAGRLLQDIVRKTYEVPLNGRVLASFSECGTKLFHSHRWNERIRSVVSENVIQRLLHRGCIPGVRGIPIHGTKQA